MKRRMFRVMALVAATVLALTLYAGVAAAHDGHYDGGSETDGIDTAIHTGADRPVGDHLLGDVPGSPGAENGFFNEDSNAIVAIGNNPLCPLNENHERNAEHE